jgi:hypothetical protein
MIDTDCELPRNPAYMMSGVCQVRGFLSGRALDVAESLLRAFKDPSLC